MIRVGYAAITWGGDDDLAIQEVSEAGFKGIQLRASAFDKWGTRPGELKDLLAKHGLTFAVLSSGNLKYQPADRGAQIDLHLSHAKFVRDAGGVMLQVIDEKPRDRPVTADDYKALADMLRRLGQRTAEIGVPLVYHHHMNSTGERPEAIEAILQNIPGASVGLLFDIAHYQQGGGDPVAFIRRYGKAIKVVHLKDVRPIDAAPGYQWVELGRGRVDVKGCVAALKDIGFDGWAIVELDRVVDAGGSPKASAAANRDYVVNQLRLPL
jgi:inosose dehydratase